MKDTIAEELNVKEVIFHEKEDELVKLLYKLYILYDDASNLALTTLASIVMKLIQTIQEKNEKDEDFLYSSNELISTYSKLIDALK